MDLPDRRLSVSKFSSSRISKSSSAPRPPSSAASSRPPDTVVSANLSNFRRVVQELTGTPPSSALSSPVRESTRSSRLQRMAPPSLRESLRSSHQQQVQQNQQLLRQHEHHHHHHPQPNLPLHNICAQDGNQQHHDFSWLSSVGLLSPPLPYTQISQNPNSNFNACSNLPSYPNTHPLPLPLSPRLFSGLPPLTPGDSTWAYPLQATPSPRPLFNSAGPLPPLLPLPSEKGEDLQSEIHHSRSEASEWHGSSSNGHCLFSSSSNGYALLPASSNGHPLLSSALNGRLPIHASCNPLLSSSNGNPPPSSSSDEHSLLYPFPNGRPLRPPSPASLSPLLPLSPSMASYSPLLPPWPTSPFLPLPFSPGVGLPSPGLSPFISSPRGLSPGLGHFVHSPRGFSFRASTDSPAKLP